MCGNLCCAVLAILCAEALEHVRRVSSRRAACRGASCSAPSGRRAPDVRQVGRACPFGPAGLRHAWVMSWEADIEAIVERTLRRVLREELHPELLTPGAGQRARGKVREDYLPLDGPGVLAASWPRSPAAGEQAGAARAGAGRRAEARRNSAYQEGTISRGRGAAPPGKLGMNDREARPSSVPAR